MPWHPYGRTTRTRRPCPSEKIAPRVISGFPPQGHLTLANPLEGRALHARRGTPWLHPGMPPLGHRACVHPSMIMPYPGLAHGLATRARRPRPSEKIAPRVISGFPPQGHLTLADPPGGAGSARPQGRLCPYREIAPSGQRPLACPSMIMTCPGLRRIRISGPAERVPVREEKLERCEARVATLGKEKSIFWSRREEVSRNSPPPWVEKCWSSGAVWRLRMEKFPFSPSGSMRRQGRSRS